MVCGHVRHIRQSVAKHPLHHLIEFDLYNQNETSHVMASLLNANSSCWGHVISF